MKTKLPQQTGTWESRLRVELDDIFETLEYYDGPNIDEAFDRVFAFTKSFFRSERQKVLEQFEKIIGEVQIPKKQWRACHKILNDLLQAIREIEEKG